MNTAMIALLSVLSVAGVGTAAVAGTQMQVAGGGMMNGGMMGDGTHYGQGPMHGGMHGDCPCCDYDEGNNTAGGGQNQLANGP